MLIAFTADHSFWRHISGAIGLRPVQAVNASASGRVHIVACTGKVAGKVLRAPLPDMAEICPCIMTLIAAWGSITSHLTVTPSGGTASAAGSARRRRHHLSSSGLGPVKIRPDIWCIEGSAVHCHERNLMMGGNCCKTPDLQTCKARLLDYCNVPPAKIHLNSLKSRT